MNGSRDTLKEESKSTKNNVSNNQPDDRSLHSRGCSPMNDSTISRNFN